MVAASKHLSSDGTESQKALGSMPPILEKDVLCFLLGNMFLANSTCSESTIRK